MKQLIELLSKHKSVGFLISTLVITILLFITLLLYGNTMLAFKEGAKLDQESEYPSTTISVEGKGKVVALPNIAQFSFTVSERAETSQLAQQLATTKINSVVEALVAAGITETDIKTSSYNIYPNYSYETREVSIDFGSSATTSGESVITSYEASQTTEIKFRNINEAGNLITLVGQKGVSNVSGVQFVVDDEDVIGGEARALAIADAKMNAAEIAQELGVELVRIVSYYENSAGSPEPYYNTARMSEGGFSVAPKLSPGEEEIVKTVSITYEIR